MKKITLKYGCNLGLGSTAKFYPAGTLLESVAPSGTFKELKVNPNSSTVCVLFPGQQTGTLVPIGQIEIEEENGTI